MIPLIRQFLDDVPLVHLLLHQAVYLILKLSDFSQSNLNVLAYFDKGVLLEYIRYV